MALAELYDLVKCNIATIGTGTVTFGTRIAGFFLPSDYPLADGTAVRYTIRDGTSVEIGDGVIAGSGTEMTRTPSRTLVGSTVDMTTPSAISLSGTALLGLTLAAEDILNRGKNLSDLPNKPVALKNLGAAQYNLINGKIVASNNGTAATFAIKGLDGNDPSASNPVCAFFPDGTTLELTAALSVTIPSTATMNVTNNVAFNLWFGLFKDSSTPYLAVRNCWTGVGVEGFASGYNSTTTIGTGSDNGGVWYTSTGVSDKPFVPIGYAQYNNNVIATAGTWAADPTRIVLYAPGMARPGDVIKQKQLIDTTVFNTASGSFQSTTTSDSVALSTAANVVKVSAQGWLRMTNASFVAVAQLHRGSTAMGTARLSADRMQQRIAGSEHSSDGSSLAASTTYQVSHQGEKAAAPHTGWIPPLAVRQREFK